ncbi:GAF domain-containing protein [Jatrophihabitans sp. YIM 134969]
MMHPRLVAFLARPSVGAALTAVVFVLGFLASVSTDWTRWLYGGLALLATVAAYLTNLAVQQRERDQVLSAEELAESVRRRVNVAVSSALNPLLRIVAQVHEEPDDVERHAFRRGAVLAALAGVATSIGPPSLTRACYFELDLDPSGVPRRLSFVAASGRADEPHTVFEGGTRAGDAALQMIHDDVTVFCRDTAQDAPPGWTDHPHRYRTFTAVPVRGDREVFGMLTVDCPHPGDLVRDRDEPLIVLFARVLAASQARRAPS